MSKCKFKVGDRVRANISVGYGRKHCGEIGTIIETTDIDVLVEFDNNINGHDGSCGSTRGKDYHCWWLNFDAVEPICKFKVGDYVIGNSNNYCWSNKGWVGKVVRLDDNGKFTAEGKWGSLNVRCIALDPKDFDLYTKDQPTKIVITTDGKTTTAKMYRDKSVVKVETTKCHPDDRFDFEVGAKIAFDRLVGEKKEEEPKECEKKIEVNDFVKVIDDGELYTTYLDWVTTLFESKYDQIRYDYGHDIDTTHKFKVLFIHKHLSDDRYTLAYIQDNTTHRCYVMGVDGLERVE